nr:MAG TPA: hypothetical protein [Caudoviricetes sp.]
MGGPLFYALISRCVTAVRFYLVRHVFTCSGSYRANRRVFGPIIYT